MGLDLARIVHGLVVWRRRGCSHGLIETSEKEILDFTRHEYGIDSLRPERSRALQLLATLGRYELPLAEGVLDPESAIVLNDLIDEGLVAREISPSSRYSLKDPKTCEWLLRALSEFAAPGTLLTEREIIKRDVESRPKRLYLWLRASALARDQAPLLAILGDEALLEGARLSLAEHSGTQLRHVLLPLVQILPKTDREKIKSLVPPGAVDALVESVQGAPAYRVRHGLTILSFFVNLHHVFRTWTPDDWQNTVAKSRVNTLRLLCYDFRFWKLPEAIRALGQQLAHADLDRLLDPGQTTMGKNGLSGLIGNLLQDAPSEALAFLARLATRDLAPLLASAPAGDVNYLISKILHVNRRELAEEFVQRNAGPLISLLERSTMPDRFWLLWNIYQSKPELAKSLVQASSVRLEPLPGDALWLPCLGLFSLCGRAPTSVPGRTDEELKSELKRRESPSLLGLSLRGIEASVPLERRTTLLNAQALREIRDRLQTFPILSTRRLLLTILDRFESGI